MCPAHQHGRLDGLTAQAGSLLSDRVFLTWGLEIYRDKIRSARQRFDEDSGEARTVRPRFPDGSTMDSEALARHTVSSLDIDAHLDFVCGYDSGFGTKPEPGMVEAFCARLSMRPAEVLVVGDTLRDLHMGRAAGAGLVVGVLSGAGNRELLAPHCDHVLESVLALESVI